MAVDPHTAQDAIWAASDTLHIVAQATGNPHLRAAADTYDRAARAPYGRIPRPTSAGTGLRTAARLLAMTGVFGDQSTQMVTILVADLIALVDTIGRLHQDRHRHAQADAARTTCAHLHRVGGGPGNSTPWLSSLDQALSPVDLALAGFPVPWSATPADKSSRVPEPVRPQRKTGSSRRPGAP
ncbi:hypothetical protein DPM19_33580 [Actinomadura craniellae]|uniref:Uncharacterized protein n=1 Tax=Actinomadura craniellae TaxID=2231787 RepID=A0A365GXT0_9ACTN|nr:hypothetical protein [Actinomadura craniellae]RAY10733.1 hypothetical protein DPM19_33580 [Actinomadura craniellae]